MPQVAMSSHGGAAPDRATKPMRELYIGNMPPHSAPEELKAFLAAAMTQGQMLVEAGDPVVTVRVSEKVSCDLICYFVILLFCYSVIFLPLICLPLTCVRILLTDLTRSPLSLFHTN